jgi:2-polyprenyl-3-methyl-5-hydroxy-6-metoxy-1,4-benzoquinol methylase
MKQVFARIHKSQWEDKIECNFCKNTKGHRRVLVRNAKNSGHNLVECPYCKLRFFEPRLKESWVYQKKQDPEGDKAATRSYRYGSMMEHASQPGFDIQKQKKSLKKYYDRIYDEMISINKEKNPRILDVGCGVGWGLHFFQQRSASLTSVGIDISKVAVDIANKQMGVKAILSRFSNCSEKELGKFDFIHANDVLEHTYTPFDDLNKMRRLSKYGGVLFLKTFAEDLDEKAGRTMMNPPGHSHHITQVVLEKMLFQSGWKLITTRISADVQISIKALAV